MKKGFSFVVLLVVCGFLLSFINTTTNPEIAIGASIPLGNEKLKDVSGKLISLNEIKTAKGLLVIFSANTCPYVKMYAERMKTITDYCTQNNIGCVLINSNEDQRKDDDSFEEMAKFSKENNITCAHLIDVSSKLADAFGATKTPQCFLFNSKELVYKGTIDDNIRDVNEVKAAYLKNAIDALLKQEKPSVQETKAIGCMIKRVE